MEYQFDIDGWGDRLDRYISKNNPESPIIKNYIKNYNENSPKIRKRDNFTPDDLSFTPDDLTYEERLGIALMELSIRKRMEQGE